MNDEQLRTIQRLFAWCRDRERALVSGQLDADDAARSFLLETEDYTFSLYHLVRLVRQFVGQIPVQQTSSEVEGPRQKKKIVLSGIRATGRMHLGNYLGVLERFANLSRDPRCQCLFFVADLHALTTRTEPAVVRQRGLDILLDILAAGVLPETATLYIQSQVPAVTELAWYLACLTATSHLERIPTYKEVCEKTPEAATAAFLTYPVLMAADILGVQADLVPVGPDQRIHLELTRDLARRFNRVYGELFPIPDAMEDEMVQVAGLAPQGADERFPKMGLVDSQTLYLNEDWLENHEKIRQAPTDPARVHRNDPGSPEKCAIYALHELASDSDDLHWSANGCRSAAISCIECKDRLERNIQARLAPFYERRRELAARPERVRALLEDGIRRTRRIVEDVTAEVADRMGVFRLRNNTRTLTRRL
jgi:tryptophanyl-tRNA synthetase